MKQIGLRSYQDIITPEEQERRDTERKLREEYEQEKAEYLAEERRERERLEEEFEKETKEFEKEVEREKARVLRNLEMRLWR